ncbi:MAG: hypothetical protein EOP13_07560 [Pseudomonas sp.]|uniref:hypothetical protein n=1 Tax=Pseudomonas sp. TaxID=306 RepID=UPI0011F5E7D2|nr:hypothetical protein [Pseudomonas sp.]RZI74792.1 MAG: hypothetical protein EOP13_07560 [Pseudomonas sp.]
MSERTTIRGLIFVLNDSREITSHGYEASYSTPVRDDIGMLSFDWTASIEGINKQPEGRQTAIRAPGDLISPVFLRDQIESMLEKHLEGKG